MKRVLKGAGIALAVLAVVAVSFYLFARHKASESISSMTYETVDMTAVDDGTYYGETDAGLVYVKVGVTVTNHSITDIQIIEHQKGLGGKAEAVTERMAAQNSWQVDAVSGATLSSEAIKSAVSKALFAGSR